MCGIAGAMSRSGAAIEVGLLDRLGEAQAHRGPDGRGHFTLDAIGLAHQRLARIIRDEGLELDVSALPRTPSGRIRRDAADALFQSVRDEVEREPDNWRHWYRLARAYDYAGDRRRAREAMRTAVALQGRA